MDMGKEMRHRRACDLVKVLSSKERDYLVRNNGEKVRIKSLLGKIVVLYTINLSERFYTKYHMITIRNMVDAYDRLSLNGDFEIVFVAAQKSHTCAAKAKHKDFFNNFFSKMPWLAVPYFDLETRMRFFKYKFMTVIDIKGVVRNSLPVECFFNFGAELYPFTKSRMREIKKEDKEALKEKTLRSLLSSSSRDYVISSSKERVPISRLEEKVVGLYFYNRREPAAKSLTPKLIEVYKELKGRGEDFEIVTINLNFIANCDDNEESFDKELKGMPWLALPFKDATCRRLFRMFNPYINDDNKMDSILVIVGPGGNIFERLGANVVWSYGINAYPFTMETVAERKILGLKKLNLQSVLIGLDIKSIYARGGEEFHISGLNGKKVLLFVGRKGCSRSGKLMQMLLHHDHGFQVIYASSDEDLSSFNSFFNQMPWVALPFNVEKTLQLSKIFKFDRGQPCLLAFGPDGTHLTNNGRVFFKDCGVNQEWQLFNYSFGQLHGHTELEAGLQLFGGHGFYNFDSDSDLTFGPDSDSECGSRDSDIDTYSPHYRKDSDKDDFFWEVDWNYDRDIHGFNDSSGNNFGQYEDIDVEHHKCVIR